MTQKGAKSKRSAYINIGLCKGQLQMVIHIPLSKSGKHAGKFEAIIDDCDADLLEQSWAVRISKTERTKYAQGHGEKHKTIHMHRVIMERVIGRPLEKGEKVDHRNCDGLDNRRENLRIATHTQNLMNTRKARNNTSGYKRVTYHKRDKKWVAHITINGKQKQLGYFKTPEEAYKAYCDAAIEFFGDFANLGE